MSSYLDERDVAELARRAQICIADDELGPMTADLNDLIGGLEPLLSFCGAANRDGVNCDGVSGVDAR